MLVKRVFSSWPGHTPHPPEPHCGVKDGISLFGEAVKNYNLEVNEIHEINHEVPKTRSSTKIKYLNLLNFVCLRDFVPSWQKSLTETFVKEFSHSLTERGFPN